MESVLLVNGPPAERKAHREVLERAGYTVKEVLAMDAALRQAREAPPLAVVLECSGRPDLQHRFITGLRGHPLTGDVPVLMVLPDECDEGLPEDVPAVGCVSDQCTPRELLEELAYITRGREIHGTEGARGAGTELLDRSPFPPAPRIDPILDLGRPDAERPPFAQRPPFRRT